MTRGHDHHGSVALRHSFAQAYAFVRACGSLELSGNEAAEDPAAWRACGRAYAAADEQGRPCLEFGDEDGALRVYECCWGKNDSQDRFAPVGLWCRLIDEQIAPVGWATWLSARLPAALAWAVLAGFLAWLARLPPFAVSLGH